MQDYWDFDYDSCEVVMMTICQNDNKKKTKLKAKCNVLILPVSFN